MSEAVWQRLAEKALGGRTIEALAGRTDEGLRIEALYQRSRTERPPALRQIAGPWSIAQRVDHPDATVANRLALIDLEGGATALTLVFADETARGFGLPVTDDALITALERVELDLISLRLDAGDQTVEVASKLAHLTTARRLTSAALNVDLGLDPIGQAARTGQAAPPPPDLRALFDETRAAGLTGRAFLADGRPYHEGGAGEVQELAAVLATGVAYLRRMESAGLSLDEANAAVAFLLVADADIFLSVAKFRALRRLWMRVEEACGVAPLPIRLHGETAWRMMTRRDPWVNVMRATAAVFAAGVGGADVITTLPFTLPLGLPEDGARRLARNTQLVLLDEAHLAKVDDPAAGSGGIEALTEQLCGQAWALFQEIEGEGGIEASLQAGRLQRRIAETRAHRCDAIATMAHGIIGTNLYPALGIADPAVFEIARRAAPDHGPLALPTARDAAPYEALRDIADTMAATGKPPTVLLATLGPPAVHGPRATYAANFFAAAGIATLSENADDVLAFSDPGLTPLVCLCASDATEAPLLEKRIGKLRDRGAKRIYFAGRPQPFASATVDDFIHPGCNALQVLRSALDFLHAEQR